MMISLIRCYESKSITISLSIFCPSIKWIVESFPCLTRISMIISFCIMKINNRFHLCLKKIEIKSYLSFDFHSIQKHKKLRFISSIKIQFNFWSCITINFKMCPCSCLIAKVLIILFYFLTYWIPSSMEIYTGKYWSLII